MKKVGKKKEKVCLKLTSCFIKYLYQRQWITHLKTHVGAKLKHGDGCGRKVLRILHVE